LKIKRTLIKLQWILSAQFGVDILKLFSSLRGLVAFWVDRHAFCKEYSGKITFKPCLHDRYEEAGLTKSEYFWQDLLVAREIHSANPLKHADIGSRVDGFVAHIASFRECEVFDVRPISTTVPGVVFRQADLMSLDTFSNNTLEGHYDSISCLHALEHFGLGRYGDPINPLGYKLGITSMAYLLQECGILYLSTPIGQERVEFNANWVFDPRNIVSCAEHCGLTLEKLIIISSDSEPSEHKIDSDSLGLLAQKSYSLGLFIFKKLHN
jgi:hypothetical protein